MSSLIPRHEIALAFWYCRRAAQCARAGSVWLADAFEARGAEIAAEVMPWG